MNIFPAGAISLLSPVFDYYFKACRKGDSEAKAVAANQSAVRALATANEITGLPRDNFEVHEITKAEFEEERGFGG